MDSISSPFLSGGNLLLSLPISVSRPPNSTTISSVLTEENLKKTVPRPDAADSSSSSPSPSLPRRPPPPPPAMAKGPSTRRLEPSLPARFFNAFDDLINNFVNPPVSPSVDPRYVLAENFAPVDELPPTECEVIQGSLPSSLNGAYVRNGPNPQYLPRGPYHLFDGDGMLHSLRISNGRAVLCSRYVKTYKYTLERHAGHPIFPNVFSGFNGLTASAARGAVAAGRMLTGQFNPANGIGLANTSLAFFGDRLYALEPKMADPSVSNPGDEMPKRPTMTDPPITPTRVSTQTTNEVTTERGRIQVRPKDCPIGNFSFTNLLNQTTSLKLDQGNFLLWQSIVLPILKSHKLEGHLTGATPSPEHSIIIPPSEDEPDGLLLPNPEYDIWNTADQLIVGWLYNSMTPEIAVQVMGYDIAKPLWDAIYEYYGVQSRSQEDHNRQMLQQTRKGNMKMREYLNLMKSYFDNLQLAGYPMDMRSFISFVINGLDEEYNPIVCVLRSQNTSWFSLQYELLSYESRQEKLQALKGIESVNQASVNYASVERTRASSQHFNSSQTHRGSYYSSSGRGSKTRGRGRYSPHPHNNRPVCQICGKIGHVASVCHHRYEKNDSQGNFSGITTNPHPGSQSNFNTTPATALMAYPETLQDSAWYLDSGASNHVTSELGNLNLKGKEVQGGLANRET